MASENGWEPAWVGQADLQWITVPGTNVSLQIRQGQPLQIMRAFAADFNAYVEPLRDSDSACYTPTNSVSTSNHLNGTAMDLNWNSHPFQILNAGFTSQQINTIRDLLDYYEDTIWWGNDWNTPKDAMHFQMGYDTYGNPHTQDFINRKIRADGFSLFRRSGAVAPVGAADVLARATGLSLARATEILPAVTAGLQASECGSINRIAMWLAQIGHESDNFNATEEYQDGDPSSDRWKYKGRTWIQITWSSNYLGFSQWAHARGLVPTDDYFVQHPTELADLRWAGLGAAWYWTVARPDINELSDARNIRQVTQEINGGQNGYADRLDRFNRALSVGDALLALVTSTPAPSQDIDPIEELLMSDLQVESLSIYATPGEPLIPIVRMVQSIDAADHRELVESAARLGDVDSLQRIARTASGQGKYTDPATVAHAKAVLADIEANNPNVLKNYLAVKGA